jgi:RNA polymerase sigma-70 factor, ECF subfamily
MKSGFGNFTMGSSPSFDSETLYRELFTPLYRYLFLRTKDRDVANDLVQSVFLKYLLQEKKPETKEHSLRLLYTIGRTMLIDHWRKKGRRIETSLEDGWEIEDDAPTPLEVALAEEERNEVRMLLTQLSAVEQDVVSLRITSDMGYEEIATIMNTSVVNARKIYSRAIQKVGALLQTNNHTL